MKFCITRRRSQSLHFRRWRILCLAWGLWPRFWELSLPWEHWEALPKKIGHKVAATLVGTFLGILLCYGLIGPIASNMGKAADEERAYLNVLKVLIISFLKGTAPIMAVESARGAIPGHVRPTFTELEQACRSSGGSTTATPEAPATEAASTGG